MPTFKPQYKDKNGIIQDLNIDYNSLANKPTTKNEIDSLKSDIDKLNSTIIDGVVDGSPQGVYDDLSALQTALPNGASGVYLTRDNGHWYYWNDTAWIDGGVYFSGGAVPETRKIAGIDLTNDITTDELQNVLGISVNDVFNDTTFYNVGLNTANSVFLYFDILGSSDIRCSTVQNYNDILNNNIRFENGAKISFNIKDGYKCSIIFYKKEDGYGKIPDYLSFVSTDTIIEVPNGYNYLSIMVGKIDNSNITPTEAKSAVKVFVVGVQSEIDEIKDDINAINDTVEKLETRTKNTILNGKLILPDTYLLPFDVIKTEKGYYPNVSINQLNNNPIKVYINVSSTDTGLGTNESNPITLYQFKQNIINDLYSTTNVELVFVDRINLYSERSNFDLIGTKNLNVKNITITAKHDNTWLGIGLNPTWEETANDGIYKFTASNKISDVCDLENVNIFELPDIYHKVSDVSSVIDEIGTFCQNENNVVYIHPRSNNDLSKIVALYGLEWTNDNQGIITMRKTTSGNVIFKNIGFLMDTLNVRYCQTLNNNLWFFNCKFHRGSQDSLGIDGLYNAYLIDCVADYASKDNFNYHGTSKDIIVAEFNCISYGAGKYKLDTTGHNTTTDSNNGSTAHNGMTIMRFGCSYWECEGSIIADVNNCKTLNVECVAKNVLPTISTANYNAIFMLHDNRNASTIYRNDIHTNYLINCGGLGATYKCDIEGMNVIVSGFNTNIENNYIVDGTYTEQKIYM